MQAAAARMEKSLVVKLNNLLLGAKSTQEQVKEAAALLDEVNDALSGSSLQRLW